jgi:uncharacterized RDD family membrane protein YckC
MTMTAETYVSRVLDALPRATPQREQIAMELRGHIAEKRAAGLPETHVLQQLGDPIALAESYLSAVPLVAASFGRRAAAKLIDVLTCAVMIAPAAWLAWQVQPEFAPWITPVLIILGTWLFAVYVVLAESRVGQTLGKRLMGIRVVRESGARISIGQSVVRQLPVFLEVFWVDVLFALFTEKSQRAFELLSKTRVVSSWRDTGEGAPIRAAGSVDAG